MKLEMTSGDDQSFSDHEEWSEGGLGRKIVWQTFEHEEETAATLELDCVAEMTECFNFLHLPCPWKGLKTDD